MPVRYSTGAPTGPGGAANVTARVKPGIKVSTGPIALSGVPPVKAGIKISQAASKLTPAPVRAGIAVSVRPVTNPTIARPAVLGGIKVSMGPFASLAPPATDKAGFKVVQHTFTLTRTNGAASVTQSAITGNGFATPTNAQGIHDGAFSTLTGSAIAAQAGTLTGTYTNPDSTKPLFTIASVTLNLYWRIVGDTLSSATVVRSYSSAGIGSTVLGTTATGTQDHSTTPETFDITAALGGVSVTTPDSSSHAITATVNGSVQPTLSNSPNAGFGKMLVFDGVNRGAVSSQGILCGSFAQAANAPFCLEMLVRVDQVATTAVYAGMYDAVLAHGAVMAFIDGSNSKWTVVIVKAGAQTLLAGAVATTGWHYVVLDYDGTTLKMWVDGTSQFSTATTIDAVASPPRFWLMRDDETTASPAPFPVQGALDECRWSQVSRYAVSPPAATLSAPLTSDANTAFLLHCDSVTTVSGVTWAKLNGFTVVFTGSTPLANVATIGVDAIAELVIVTAPLVTAQ